MARDIIQFPTAQEGLAAELSLLDATAQDSQARSLIWAAEHRSLTLPERFSRTDAFAAASDTLDKSGWPVITRRTGGGITPQGPGVLNVALAFSVPPKDARSVPASYAAICDPLIEAFATMGLTARAGSVASSFCDGDYNLEIQGRKIVGTAQRWRGASVLCHALVLIDLSLDEAVGAAQRLSDGLFLGDNYAVAAHTTLSQNLGPDADLDRRFATAVAEQLDGRGLTSA